MEFYWDDLTKEKQNEIFEVFGGNMNWDVFPFCIIETDEENEEDEDEYKQKSKQGESLAFSISHIFIL